MLRKIVLSLLVLAMVSISISVSAADYPRVRIDGEFVYMQDQQAVIVDGRTLVPLRAVMEHLGFNVEWEQAPLNRARLTKPGFNITVTIGRETMAVNGENITLDVPAKIMNDRTLVPLRAISEATGMLVEWDGINFIVDVQTTPSEITANPPTSNAPPTYAETRSSIVLTNERITDQQLTEWKVEYRMLGGANEFELEVVRLINVERLSYGLSPLAIDEDLMMAARFKSQEMDDLDYYSHDSPVYGGSQGIPRLFGIDRVGENLARNATPENVVNAWINSPGHRATFLVPTLEFIGIGVVGHSGGRGTYTTMMVN